MYRNYIQRDSEYMNRLKDVICEQYHIDVIDITPAKRGYYGETWKLETPDNFYFAKLDYFKRHQKIFRNSLPVVDYLCENGIGFINNVIKTRDGKLNIFFDAPESTPVLSSSAVLGVFEWIDGENIETDETKTPEYQMLCEIYKLTKSGFEIPVFEFSDKAAVDFYDKCKRLNAMPQSKPGNHVLSLFEQLKSELSHCSSRLAYLSSVCRRDKSHFYITHGDAGGNFIVGNGRNYIVDWDEVMYAPIERDAWVMCCHSWAVKLFNNTLKQAGIDCILRPERLAFYCYHMFFYYLCEFMNDFLSHGEGREIEGYLFQSWIWDRIKFADTI
ncbi:MAG: aminoglycoside phosphotransferase family protein [Firmicutes bacterium]|nr:aminoglycoside phosphotransferase family protein [Bacillota bacterium]